MYNSVYLPALNVFHPQAAKNKQLLIFKKRKNKYRGNNEMYLKQLSKGKCIVDYFHKE